MQTRCPHCHTIFRVKNSELELADGQVRCGYCLAVFFANDPLNSIADEIENSDNLNDVTNSDSVIQQSNSDTNQHIIADVIPPELRAETRRKKTHFGFIGNLLLTIAILACIAAGALQYTYYNRTELVKIEKLRPWLEKACALAKCTLPQAKDSTLFLLSSKNIFTHPNVNKALMVSATIINQASFAQEFPMIELRFANVRGETIAARRFTPGEYLNIPENQISKIQPNTPVSFTLEIKDPGNEMVSYEFDFL